MNHLNSVLLEGDIADAPREAKTANGKTTCTFQIDSKREHKDDATREEVSRITVQTTGRLAESCIATLGKAGGVRVVGHIKQDKEAGLIVVAEHVEFKPKNNASAANSAREDL